MRTLSVIARGPLAALLVLVTVLAPRAASAQTQADLFDDTSLRDIQLTVSQRDWDTLRAQADENTYYTADLRWNGVAVRNVGIRSRGAGTRNGVKPGLRLDFNRYLADQEFLGLKALVLDNAYTDPSTMRELLAMKLYARLGLSTPREAHVRLFVNGEYAGLYVAVEPIDRTFIGRVFGAAEANVERGGYLFEYKWKREWGFEYLGNDLAPYAELFEPKTRETDAASLVYGPLEEVVRRINDSPPERLQTDVGSLVDLDELVRYLALQNAVGEIDGLVGNWGVSNFYLYRFGDGRPAQFLPWDADHSFWDPNMPIDERLDTDVLTRKLMELPSLRRRYLETLMEASQTIANQASDEDPRGWLEREVDRLEPLITPAAAADTLSPFSFEEFAGNLRDLRALLRSRPAAVTDQAAAARAALDTP
jgi:spore coat protein CotH